MAGAAPDARAEAGNALEDARDRLTVAVDALTRLQQVDEAARQVGRSSSRLAMAAYHLRRLVRERQ